jgi:hypothetical protein
MFGSTGPRVIDQSPCGSRTIFSGVLGGAFGRVHSPATVTAEAPGALSRKVIRPSAWTSGDCPGAAEVAAAISTERMIVTRRSSDH